MCLLLMSVSSTTVSSSRYRHYLLGLQFGGVFGIYDDDHTCYTYERRRDTAESY